MGISRRQRQMVTPWVPLGLLFSLSVVTTAWSDEPSTPSSPSKSLTIPSLGVPEEPLEPFLPAKPIVDAEKAKLEAQKLFVIGLGEVSRRQSLAARRTFEKAVALDPSHLGALKELVPLALQSGDSHAALDYGRRALELDQNDYQLLHLLATLQAQAGKLPESVELLIRASNVKGVVKEDPREFLQIRSDLAQHLTTLGRLEEAIEPLRDILQFTENPDEHDRENLRSDNSKGGSFRTMSNSLGRWRKQVDSRKPSKSSTTLGKG